MKRHKLTFCLLLLLAPLLSSGQYYSAGTDPARARWRQISTGSYRIIYPREIDSLARRYAFLFEKATPHVMAPLKAKTPSIPVVLHPYTIFSNGMVVWAPKRMELYTTPPPSSYAQKWEKQLVLHETRHVGQMSKLSQNFFRFAEYIIGQQSQGIAAGGYVTKWMLEGDAVLSETEHSFSGRGREAAFLMPYRAYLLDGISFSWDTWRFGSYKYDTPNEYTLGYYLLSTLQYRQGKPFLSDIFDVVTKRPLVPFVNLKAFKRSTGQTRIQNWDSATELMRAIWNRQLAQNGPLTPYHTITDSVPTPKIALNRRGEQKRPSVDYANYESITALSAGSVYAFYNNLNRGTSLVEIGSHGQRKHIRYVGNVSSPMTEGGGKLYWTELVPGLRWEQESFSLLRSYDPKSHAFSTLSKKSRYFSPSLSPSSQKIAVVHAAITGASELHIIHVSDNSLWASYLAPDQGQIQSSAWISESLLYASVLTDSGLGIYALDLNMATWNTIISPQSQTISRLRYQDGLLLFSSDLNGVDNIYALDPTATPVQLFALTHAKYGAFDPFPMGDTLYYTHYTHAGLRPVFTPVNSLQWKRANFSAPYESSITKELSQQAAFRLDTVAVPEYPHYPSKPYRKATHLIRVHSWAPLYFNPTDNISSMSMEELYNTALPGAMIFSQNTLSTAVAHIGYAYHNGFHAGHLKFTYRGWYPVIELSGDLNDRKAIAYKVETDTSNTLKSKVVDLENSSFRASANIYIPFNLRSRGWVRGLIPRLLFSFRNDQYFSPNREAFDYYTSLQAGIQYYQYRSLTIRNIFPRWGFGVSLQTLSVPWMQDAFGSELYLMAYGYIPGIAANQGIRIRATAQRQWSEGKLYYLSNVASWPRGYDNQISEEFYGLSIDYAIPVWLHDKSIGGLIYFKRLQFIPFVDYAQNRNHRGTDQLLSAGADLLLQFHVLRIGSPISAGVRSIVNKEGTPRFEMLFNIAI